MRVTRVTYVELISQDARYPIFLPQNNCIAKLIVKYYHGRKESEEHESSAGDVSVSFMVVKKSGNGRRARVKLVLFSDHMSCFLKDRPSYEHLISLLEEFTAVSGLKVNNEKVEFL